MAWVRQLLDEDTLALLRIGAERQVDVRLSAANGKVRRRPAVTFDAGPQEMVLPRTAVYPPPYVST